MKQIKYNNYEFRAKVGGKYVIPGGKGGHYYRHYYKEKDIPNIIKEIEAEYPRYKGKIKPFRLLIEEVQLPSNIIKKSLKAIKAIEREIAHYGIRKDIAEAMRELGSQGFEFCGHGYGLSGGYEDFSLFNKHVHVNFCDKHKKCEVTISDDNELVFNGTIVKAMNYLSKNKLTRKQKV